MKSFVEATALIAAEHNTYRPLPCQQLLAVAAGYAGTKAGPATQGQLDKWEAAALARILTLLGESSQGRELLEAVTAARLTPTLWVDEDGRVNFGYDITEASGQGRWASVQIEMPTGPAYYQGETNPSTAEELEAIEALGNWMPTVDVWGGRMAGLLTAEAIARMATKFAEGLTKSEVGQLGFQAQQAGRALAKNLPGRVWIAAQAPPVPVGWAPANAPEPTHPSRWEKWATVCQPEQSSEYRQDVELYRQHLQDWSMLKAIQWPLAWADALLLMNATQQ